jgi:AmmeMemoRadiSam system protein B
MHRHPAVAGQFYRGTAAALREQVAGYLRPEAEKTEALGIVSPHAGLMYSGAVAGALYSRIRIPDTIVLIGPNHTGLGAPVSLMPEGTWDTPLGSVGIDAALARAILSQSKRIQEDSLAHLHEHSLEVQLPFIQSLKKEFSIVPIQMLDTRLETCMDLGRAVADAIRERGGESGRAEVLVVASSDMSHYEQADRAREKDFRAISRILELDPRGLYETVREYGITMCGYGPAVAMLNCAILRGATRAELVKYANSGDVSGDYDQVVGYAGVIIM